MTQIFPISGNFIQRQRMRREIFQQYPNMIPIVLERMKQNQIKLFDNQITLECIVSSSLNPQGIIKLLEQKLMVDEQTKIFIYCGQKLIPWNLPMKEIYKKYKDIEDGYLYLQYGLVQRLN